MDFGGKMLGSTKILTVCTGLAILASCGGGGDGMSTGNRANQSASAVEVVVGNGAPIVSVPSGYQKIIGTHSVSFLSVRDSQLQQTNGAERLSDGAIIVADELQTFSGSAGYDAAGTMFGDVGRLAILTPDHGTYDTAKMYSGAVANTSTGLFYSVLQGVYGAESTASAISNTGTAVYTGDAIGRVYSEGVTNPSTYLTNGVSTLNVDFAGGTADLVMDSFRYSTSYRGFDKVNVNGMAISGNRFEGGTVQLLSNGVAVDAMGANTETAATGVFLGAVNGAGVPDEVGGQVYMRGADHAYVGTFIAD